MAKAVFCLSSTDTQVQLIVGGLRAAGFRRDDVSLLFPDKGTRSIKTPGGASVGPGTGAVLRGAVGWLAGIVTLSIPGMGPFIAAGPIASALGGGTGLTDTLVGLGISEDDAKLYESKIRDGSILIAVHTDDADERVRAKEIFESFGAEDILVA